MPRRLFEVREVVIERAAQQRLQRGALGVAAPRVGRELPHPSVLAHGVGQRADEEPQVLGAALLLLAARAAVQQAGPAGGAAGVGPPAGGPRGGRLREDLHEDVGARGVQRLEAAVGVQDDLEERAVHAEEVRALPAPPPLLVEAAEGDGLLGRQLRKVEQDVRRAHTNCVVVGVARRCAGKEELLPILEALPGPWVLVVRVSNDGRLWQRQPGARERCGVPGEHNLVTAGSKARMPVRPAEHLVLRPPVLPLRVGIEALVVERVRLAEVARGQRQTGKAAAPPQGPETPRAGGGRPLAGPAARAQAAGAGAGPQPGAERLRSEHREHGQGEHSQPPHQHREPRVEHRQPRQEDQVRRGGGGHRPNLAVAPLLGRRGLVPARRGGAEAGREERARQKRAAEGHAQGHHRAPAAREHVPLQHALVPEGSELVLAQVDGGVEAGLRRGEAVEKGSQLPAGVRPERLQETAGGDDGGPQPCGELLAEQLVHVLRELAAHQASAEGAESEEGGDGVRGVDHSCQEALVRLVPPTPAPNEPSVGAHDHGGRYGSQHLRDRRQRRGGPAGHQRGLH
mmetsp:Transcript_106709/g.339816  ORF Transcript_106709/g.339816 Transcript_106709/m.339816 type:complete len:570 (-) Transcript_106709:944-2653(-)